MAAAAGSAVLTQRAALRRFADATLAAAEEAACNIPLAARTLSVGGARVRVRVAGAELGRRLMPALPEHHPPPGAPAAGLLAVDAAASGRPPPPPPWGRDAYRPRDELAGFGDASLEVAYALHPGTLTVWSEHERRGVWWTRDAAAVPVWEEAAPLRGLLRWALRGQGVHVIHGAAVGDRRGAVLLAGPGGTGKSATALAAALAGMEHLADDYCGVSLDPPTVHRMFEFGKADDATLSRLPGLAPAAAGAPRTPEGKCVLRIPGRRSGSPVSLPIRALVLPRVSDRTGSAEAATARDALAALAPTTLLQLPGSRSEDHAALAKLAAAIPAVRLPLGPDPAEVVGALDSVLAAATA